VFLGSVATTACNPSRPEQAWDPTPEVVREAPTGEFTDGGADQGGGMAPPPANLPPGGDGGVPVDPKLAKLLGYYYLRADIEGVISETQVGITVSVFNRVTHFSVTQLYQDGNAIKALERPCHLLYEHTCRQGCNSFSTTIAPGAVPLMRTKDLTRTYELTDQGGFLTNAVGLGLGWDGPTSSVPTSLSSPGVWDHNRDGAPDAMLVQVSIRGLPRGPFGSGSDSLDCFFNMAELFNSAYLGKLEDGSLDGVSGRMDLSGSAINTLAWAPSSESNCAPTERNTTTTDTFRFARIADKDYDEDAFWGCPSAAEFRAKLPNP
jgi:hypothetical protein